jgi:putative aminopeptidase FrvX
MLDLFETIKKLAAVHSPSGSEEAVSAAIADIAAPYADEITKDALGNLIVFRKGAEGGRKIMVSAHMDSIGMVVTHIDEKGFLRFSNIGGLAPESLLNVPVKFANGTRGVISKEEKAGLKDLKLHELFIDIGAASREEASQMVRVSDTAVYATETLRQGDTIISPYLDDRIGCVVLLMALQSVRAPKNDLYFVFSVQEELGMRGAKTSAYGIEPDIGLAVDVTGANDTPGRKSHMDCAMGKGVAIKVMDSSLICSPRIVSALEQTAKENDIPYQFEVLERGGTDAGAIQLTRAGIRTGAISIPTRYIHGPQEMAHERDIRAAAALLSIFVANEIRT